MRKAGESRGIGDREIEAAIKGLPYVMRVEKPWPPYKLFCKKNASLWVESLSVGMKNEQKKHGTTANEALKSWAKNILKT